VQLNKSIYTLGVIAFMATMALVSWPISTVTAADPKNGWGDATSEEAGEEKQGQELGEHAADPDEDDTPGNDNNVDDGENSHRSGLGNLANPDDLGKLLDCADGDDPGDGGSIEACS
jgi:hypothetical protein